MVAFQGGAQAVRLGLVFMEAPEALMATEQFKRYQLVAYASAFEKGDDCDPSVVVPKMIHGTHRDGVFGSAIVHFGTLADLVPGIWH